MVICPHCDAINRVPMERLGDGPNCGKCKGPLFEGRPIALAEQNFDRYLAHSELPLVVDFWAPWCGPCQMMAPAYEQAAARIEPRARLAKVDTEQNPKLAVRFAVKSIPTLTIFKGGRPAVSQPGAMGLAQLVRWIEANL